MPPTHNRAAERAEKMRQIHTDGFVRYRQAVAVVAGKWK
jgi:hypothetical protein